MCQIHTPHNLQNYFLTHFKAAISHSLGMPNTGLVINTGETNRINVFYRMHRRSYGLNVIDQFHPTMKGRILK